MKTYKIIVKGAKNKTLYKTNEIYSSSIQYELDWLTRHIDLEGLTIIIKPIKDQKKRREVFQERIGIIKKDKKEINLDDLDKLEI